MLANNNEMDKEGQAAMMHGARLAEKGIAELENPDTMKTITEGLQKSPKKTISVYATTFTNEARKAGVNDLPALMVAGAMIISYMVNILAEAGVPEEGTIEIQGEAMTEFSKQAIKMDRAQNGYTEQNTPDDGSGEKIDGPPKLTDEDIGNEKGPGSLPDPVEATGEPAEEQGVLGG